MRVLLPLLLIASALAAQDLPDDVAAQHPEGKWKIRTADLYRYLVRYNGGSPSAIGVLPEYMKRRLVEDDARRRKLTVTRAEVNQWLKKLDEQVKQSSGESLAAFRKRMGMKASELRRRGRQWLLQEKLARAVFNEKDPSRKKDRPLSEDSVILVIDTLFKDAPKVLDRKKLKKGVVAKIRDVEITEYQYGRELRHALPATEVYRALRALILVAEVKVLTGNDDPPTDDEMASQKEWYLTFEKNRLKRQIQDPSLVTDKLVEQMLAKRGLRIEDVYSNPAFQAQARARGFYNRKLTDDDLQKYFEENKLKYGDRVRIARILVGARGQAVPGVGRKVRTLHQGKTFAQALWMRATGGQDFGKLARENSEDPDVIKLNGGTVPFWLTAATPGYQDSYAQAVKLDINGISKPFFSQGRGYVILKLLEREKAPGFHAQRATLRHDLAEREYHLWRNLVTQQALKNKSILKQQ